MDIKSRTEEIYIQYLDKVLAYISSRIYDRREAEDLASTVFLKVLGSLESFDSERASISTWIYTISQNTVRDYLRRQKTMGAHTGSSENMELLPFEDSLANGDGLVREEELEQLAAALEQLPERERDIIVLRYMKEYSPKQIAELLGISYSNVRFLNHRAVQRLREIMTD